MEDREYMDEKLGIEGTKFLMDSGIIGCTIGKLQVKCLHAHIGDHLMRGTNEIGKEALAKLETRGMLVLSSLLGCLISLSLFSRKTIGFLTEVFPNFVLFQESMSKVVTIVGSNAI